MAAMQPRKRQRSIVSLLGAYFIMGAAMACGINAVNYFWVDKPILYKIVHYSCVSVSGEIMCDLKPIKESEIIAL